MPKAEKVEKVKALTAQFQSSSGAMLADYRGLSVKDATQLRRGLREADARLVVAKNTLARIAVKDAGLEELLPLLEGPTAIAFLRGDAVAGAKVLLELSRRFPALAVKGALVDGLVMGEEQARSLATLESKEVSFAKLAGMLQAPLARMIFLLQAPLQRIAYALAERGKQGGTEEAPPAAEEEATPATEEAAAPTEEASAEEPAAEQPEEQAAEEPAAEEPAAEPDAETSET
jgi:large subunit ribosomal protein L10